MLHINPENPEIFMYLLFPEPNLYPLLKLYFSKDYWDYQNLCNNVKMMMFFNFSVTSFNLKFLCKNLKYSIYIDTTKIINLVHNPRILKSKI